MPTPEPPVEAMPIRSVAVLGAGTMGGGIAAHLANIGFEVTLLDVSAERAAQAVAKAIQARPPHFYVSDTAERIRCGSVSDNLSWACSADWVCEAVFEDLETKRALYAALDPLLPKETLITTNTSGLQIEMLAEGRSESFQRRFMGTHFFNPPRYLKLLELIPTTKTDPQALARMAEFLEARVARRVVEAKDTPGFIANRFGMWAMFHAIHTAEDLRLSVEQVDAITGPFLGRPRSASFRLNDIVGLDIMRDIAANIRSRCPNDPHVGSLELPSSMAAMLERGWIGEKAGRGYYRKEGAEFLALDLSTLAYRQRQDAAFESLAALAKKPLGERVREALTLKDEAGEFLRNHLVPVLRYADALKEEISHSVLDFDRVMMWGFGWEMGPFAMADAIGHDALASSSPKSFAGDTYRTFEGSYVAIPKPEVYRTLADCPIKEEATGLRVRDLGDGVSAIGLTTKMGTFNPTVVAALHDLLDRGGLEPFVLTSEARSFSVGYDLQFFLDHALAEDFATIEKALVGIQSLGRRLSATRCVAAVQGHCLGGGLEVAMSCPQIAVHPESQLGLPEANVGLIPAGGGLAMMRLRAQNGGAKQIADMAIQVFSGVMSTCADDARKKGYLRESDVTVYHPDRLLDEAKHMALTVAPTQPMKWAPAEGPLSGMIDRLKQELKAKSPVSAHDELIVEKIRTVFAKATSFDDAFGLERKGFLDLCAKALTHARIKHMLSSGKPLRN